MRILILGGDLRNEFLFKELSASGYEVDKFALRDCDQKTIRTQDYRLIIGPIPFSKDNIHVYTPLYSGAILISDFLQSISASSTLMTGSIPEGMIVSCNHIDLTKNKWLYDESIIATSEGILQLLLDNIEYTINGSNILITGFGKVGKSISKMLKALNATIGIYSTNTAEQEEFQHSYAAGKIQDLSDYDIIINTIPAVIFTDTNLKTMRKDTLLLDVASFPGGIDRKYAENNSIAFINAPGIPGKKAPLSVAKAMKQVIIEYIEKAQ
jgi:dipicolinate synthase subunit A